MQSDSSKTISTPRGDFHLLDSQEGYPLVFLHGWPESSHCWEGLVPFMEPGFRLIRPDTRGMGDSIRSLDQKDYQKTELAQDILAVLDKLGIDRFGLIGHDWGGVIAQEMALAAPERVERLALLNIIVINNQRGNAAARETLKDKGMTHIWYQIFQQQPNLPEAMIQGNERLWLSHFLRLAKKRVFPKESLDEYERVFKIPGTPATSANYYRAQYYDMKRWQSLEGVKFSMPGLYIHGKRDAVILPEYHHYIEDCFEKEVEVVQLDEGHFIQEEAPEEVAEVLNAFFQNLK